MLLTEELLIIVTVKPNVKVGVNWNNFFKNSEEKWNFTPLALENTSGLLKDSK